MQCPLVLHCEQLDNGGLVDLRPVDLRPLCTETTGDQWFALTVFDTAFLAATSNQLIAGLGYPLEVSFNVAHRSKVKISLQAVFILGLLMSVLV